MTLRERLVAVLEVGGPRKPSILKALAQIRGHSAAEFTTTVRAMRRARQLRITHRHGGPHYALPKHRT